MQWALKKSTLETWIAVLFIMMSTTTISAETTIILIDAQPVLVQLGPKGEIYERYIEVPEYFRSSRSHEGLVSRYKKRMGILSNVHRVFDPCHFLAVSDGHDDVGIVSQYDVTTDMILATTSIERTDHQARVSSSYVQPKSRSTKVQLKEEYLGSAIGGIAANKQNYWIEDSFDS